jgi:hypothetical protein
LGIGDWGLGIGPNPQSPIPNYFNKNNLLFIFVFYKIIILKNLKLKKFKKKKKIFL